MAYCRISTGIFHIFGLLLLVLSLEGKQQRVRKHRAKEHVDATSDLNHVGYEAEDEHFVDGILAEMPAAGKDVGAALLQGLVDNPDIGGTALLQGLVENPDIGGTALLQGLVESPNIGSAALLQGLVDIWGPLLEELVENPDVTESTGGGVGAGFLQALGQSSHWAGLRSSRVRRTAVHSDESLWPYGRVPYIFAPEIERSDKYRNAIMEAMAHVEDVTCVRFARESRHYARDKKLVKFRRGSSCHSSVGKSTGVGEQDVTLTKMCAYRGYVTHELGHLLGLWHEHARSDRDNNVLVLLNNVRPTYENNFNKVDPVRLLAPYDLSSMMHYDMRTFTADGDPTIRPLDPDLEFLLGQKQEFSFYDQYTLNTLYNCSDSCYDAPACDHGGFLSKMCVCICPAGLTGDTCQHVDTDNDCGGVFEVTDTMELTSPGYPQNYPNRKQCRWLMKSPVGTMMTLEVTDMDIEESSRGCRRDQLEVRYHHIGVSNGPVYCGTQLNRTFETTGNLLLIRFSSNTSTRKRGFRGIVTVQDKTDCSHVPCMNGGTCEDLPPIGTYHCRCPNMWVGHNCEVQIRDGGWSDWSPWSSCVATCGKRFRQRTCTNPTAANGGRDCLGPLYNTGTCGTHEQCKDAFSCDFGTSNNSTLCGLIDEMDTDELDWQTHQGPTSSSLTTGPVSGHTSGDNEDTYIYLEASVEQPYDAALIWLPQMNLKIGLYCLQFFYHMRGEAMGTLSVFRKVSRTRAIIMWQRTGDQGRHWREANIDVLFFRHLELGLMGVRGDTYSSDIAIDDISLSPGACDDMEHNSYGGYGCEWGNRRYSVGPFVASDGCIQMNCFCNSDGHVDCPEWQNENVCQPVDLTDTAGPGANLVGTTSGDGGPGTGAEQHTHSTRRDTGLDRDEWPHWLQVANGSVKKRRGKRIRIRKRN